VPPQNKPLPTEMAACRPYLRAQMDLMPNVRCVIALGRIAHESFIRSMGAKPTAYPFGHGRQARLSNLLLIDSYHWSRYNTNTGRLTTQMFEDVVEQARDYLNQEE